MWKEGLFTEQGKWMDGWESRRKRTAGHDWCLLELGIPGEIAGFTVDTAFFTGNNAPRCSIEATDDDALVGRLPGGPFLPGPRPKGVNASDAEVAQAEAAVKAVAWTALLPMTPLRPGYPETRKHDFPVAAGLGGNGKRWKYLKLSMYPDGGIARVRAYGKVQVDWQTVVAASQQASPNPLPLLTSPLNSSSHNVHRCSCTVKRTRE